MRTVVKCKMETAVGGVPHAYLFELLGNGQELAIREECHRRQTLASGHAGADLPGGRVPEVNDAVLACHGQGLSVLSVAHSKTAGVAAGQRETVALAYQLRQTVP